MSCAVLRCTTLVGQSFKMSKLIMPKNDTANHNNGTLKSSLEHPIFSMAFRPLFLMASCASVVILGVWLALLFGQLTSFKPVLTPLVWHAHEMIFAFAATVAVGFLLTAVQTWTGRKTLPPAHLLGLIILWCLIRLSMWLLHHDQAYLVVVLQAIWWCWVITQFSLPIIASKNRRNYILIPFLVVLMSCNLTALIADIAGYVDFSLHLMRTCILLFTLLMALIGGRVIPFFTRSGCAREGIIFPEIKVPHLIEIILPLASVAGVMCFFVGYFVVLPFTAGVLIMLAGGLHLLRMIFWLGHKTGSIALLWSLHLSYLFMAIGLMLLGSSYFHSAFSFSAALHVITLGAIGLMILSMMSRVSLGHTGRALKVSRWIMVAFICLLLAVISRFVLTIAGLPVIAWVLSSCFWGSAFIFFCSVYWPILTQPRQE